jgi:hypothetical protein
MAVKLNGSSSDDEEADSLRYERANNVQLNDVDPLSIIFISVWAQVLGHVAKSLSKAYRLAALTG